MENNLTWLMGLVGLLLTAGVGGYVAWTASNISRIWRRVANQQAQLAANAVKLEAISRIEAKLDRLLVNHHKAIPPCASPRDGKPGL